MEGCFVEEDVLYRRTFCMGGRFVEGHYVEGRFVARTFRGRTFCSSTSKTMCQLEIIYLFIFFFLI